MDSRSFFIYQNSDQDNLWKTFFFLLKWNTETVFFPHRKYEKKFRATILHICFETLLKNTFVVSSSSLKPFISSAHAIAVLLGVTAGFSLRFFNYSALNDSFASPYAQSSSMSFISNIIISFKYFNFVFWLFSKPTNNVYWSIDITQVVLILKSLSLLLLDKPFIASKPIWLFML